MSIPNATAKRSIVVNTFHQKTQVEPHGGSKGIIKVSRIIQSGTNSSNSISELCSLVYIQTTYIFDNTVHCSFSRKCWSYYLISDHQFS